MIKLSKNNGREEKDESYEDRNLTAEIKKL